MAHIRTVKPQLFKHEALYDAERETGLPLRVAFIGLFCCCDRKGRFKWHPRTLKSDVLPFDDVDFSRVLDALTTRGYVRRYACSGEEFGEIPTFCKHQIVNNREASSEIPPPPEGPPDKALTRAPRVPHASGACTSGIRNKEGNKEKKKHNARTRRADSAPRFDARAHLVSLGIDEKLADDWLAVRKGKRAEVTATAIAGVIREAGKAGISLDGALRRCCEQGWAGFRASWLERERGGPGQPGTRGACDLKALSSLDDDSRAALARQLGIAAARPGESMQAFVGRIQAAQNGHGKLH